MVTVRKKRQIHGKQRHNKRVSGSPALKLENFKGTGDINTLNGLKGELVVRYELVDNGVSAWVMIKPGRFQRKNSSESGYSRVKLFFKQRQSLPAVDYLPLSIPKSHQAIVHAKDYLDIKIDLAKQNYQDRFTDRNKPVETIADQFIDFLSATRAIIQINVRSINKGVLRRLFPVKNDPDTGYKGLIPLDQYELMKTLETGKYWHSFQVLVTAGDKKELKTCIEGLKGIFKANLIQPGVKKWRIDPRQPLKTRSRLIMSGSTVKNWLEPPAKSYFGISQVKAAESTGTPFYLESLFPHEQKWITAGKWVNRGKVTDIPARIPFSEFIKHFIVIGLTGEGKSRCIYRVIDQLNGNGVKVIVFDVKGEYRHFMKKEFLYYKAGSSDHPLEVNLFHVPDYVPDREKRNYADFVSSTLVRGIEKDNLSVTMERIIQVVTLDTVLNGGSINTFLQALNREKLHQLGIGGNLIDHSITALRNRMEKFKTGILGEILTSKVNNFHPDEILSRNTVFDLSELLKTENNEIMKLIVECIAQSIVHYLRSHKSGVNEGELSNVIIIEESQLQLQKDRGYNTASPLKTVAQTIRAYGVGMGYICTEPDLMDESLVRNTSIALVFWNKNNPFSVAEKVLGIDRRYYETLLRNLSQRQAILAIRGVPVVFETDVYLARL